MIKTHLYFSLIISYFFISCTTVKEFFSFFSYNKSSSSLVIRRIPPRPNDSIGGKKFIKLTEKLNKKQREEYIIKEILKGNIPDFLRNLKQIKLHFKQNNKTFNAILWVMPDYLSIGSNVDYVRIPMDPVSAQRIADAFGFLLPTTKLCDEIYKQAQIKLNPHPLPAGPMMSSNQYYLRHNEIINNQLKDKVGKGYLIAGHKKDVVISNRLNELPFRVAIYGWHRPDGKPIQPLSIVHSNDYADYSHGIRLISNYMLINGKEYLLENVLKDKTLCPIVSYECPLLNPRIKKQYKTEIALKM